MPSNPAIIIHDFQLSLIWFDTQLSLLQGTADSTTVSFSFLARRDSYEQMFNAVKQSTDAVTNLQLPWQSPPRQKKNKSGRILGEAKHFFWQYYLELEKGDDINSVNANQT